MEDNTDYKNKNKDFSNNSPLTKAHLNQTLRLFTAHMVYLYLLHVLPMIYCWKTCLLKICCERAPCHFRKQGILPCKCI